MNSDRPKRFLLSIIGWTVLMSCQISRGEPEKPSHVGEPGEWGVLQSFEAVIEPASSLLLDPDYTNPQSVWTLPPEWTRDQIKTFLEEAGVGGEFSEAFLSQGNVLRSGDGTLFFPPAPLIQRITPITRNRLYTALGQWQANSFEAYPFSLGANRIETLAKLAPHTFSQELISLADTLIYENEDGLLFADYPLICQQIPDPESRIAFAKLLLRTPTLMVNLRFPGQSDIEKMRRYWSSDGQNSSSLPLLDSLIDSAKEEKPASIDLVYLLPPVPKSLLFTFTRSDSGVGSSFPDCFWTALNFFSSEPNQRYFDPVLKTVVEEDWSPVSPPYQFGDLMIFYAPDLSTARHACNYIADDIVFTKNGRSMFRPWVLQRLEKVRAEYGATSDDQIKVYRPKR
ncbi:MAG: hypothetical protein KDN20_16605 [Verrucomicrobiae bacterium]|nr:hypothetical protein [Verrucomicrobiae bacterium]